MSYPNDDDALSSALSSRRMAHGHGRNNGRSGGRSKNKGQAMFDPLKAVGVYEVKCGAVKSEEGGSDSSLIVHGFTEGETGLWASLRVGEVVNGVAVLAGSRKGVMEIVGELEEEEGDGGEGEGEGEEGAEREEIAEDEDQDEEEADTGDIEPRSAIEEEDDRINRRAKAFEKNSFRNPKFWMCWNASVKVDHATQAVNEQDMGYIVFSGNDCSAFEGTISSKELGWDNVKIKGIKIKSHAPRCNSKWTDFSRDDDS